MYIRVHIPTMIYHPTYKCPRAQTTVQAQVLRPRSTDSSLAVTVVITSYLIVKESEVVQSCPTLWDPMDCSLPGFSVHGILQARILEWVAVSFSRGSSQPKD